MGSTVWLIIFLRKGLGNDASFARFRTRKTPRRRQLMNRQANGPRKPRIAKHLTSCSRRPSPRRTPRRLPFSRIWQRSNRFFENESDRDLRDRWNGDYDDDDDL